MNGKIFRVTLGAQARYLAPVLALAVVLATLLPLLTVQGVAQQTQWWGGRTELLLEQSRGFAPFYPAMALCFGIFFAAANWLPDVWTRWVYVFTLPVPRPQLALIRLAAGIVLMTPAVLALWVAGLVGSRMADLPSVVEAHPGAIALRFGAATLVSYALTSLLVLLGRRVWYVGLALILLVVLQGLGVDFGFSLTDTLFLHPLSPLHVFAGQWFFLDV
jgi:hypothetical protein